MIVRSNKIFDGLISTDYKGGKFTFTHAQNIDDSARIASDLRKATDETKGWSKSKEFKLIASIPMLEYVKHPEWVEDRKALLKWLKTDYGSLFKVSNP